LVRMRFEPITKMARKNRAAPFHAELGRRKSMIPCGRTKS
jgi:hypothetical protein